MFHFYEVPGIAKLVKTRSGMVVAGVEGWGDGELVFNGIECRFGKIKRSGGEWRWLYNNVKALNATEQYLAIKMVQIYVMYILPQ